MFFTIWYGVYQRSTRQLSYTGGGHPPPLLVQGPSSGNAVAQLACPGPPVGVVPDGEFPTLHTAISPGASLLLYSDGVTEVWVEPHKLWGVGGLVTFVRSHAASTRQYLDELHALATKMAGHEVLADDFSAVLANFP
jgi:sigma-B regulation protein RsbU (phosphoserine phosphatase)